LTQLFVRFQIRVDEAALIVEQTMLALLHKWSEIEAPEEWLEQTVLRRCRRLSQKEDRRIPLE
jgi:hypothetical protein